MRYQKESGTALLRLPYRKHIAIKSELCLDKATISGHMPKLVLFNVVEPFNMMKLNSSILALAVLLLTSQAQATPITKQFNDVADVVAPRATIKSDFDHAAQPMRPIENPPAPHLRNDPFDMPPASRYQPVQLDPIMLNPPLNIPGVSDAGGGTLTSKFNSLN